MILFPLASPGWALDQATCGPAAGPGLPEEPPESDEADVAAEVRLLQTRAETVGSLSAPSSLAPNASSSSREAMAPPERNTSSYGRSSHIGTMEVSAGAETETTHADVAEGGDVDDLEASGHLSWDHNGKLCMLCGKPLAERLGDKNYSRFRSDCGGHSSSNGPTDDGLELPAAELAGLGRDGGTRTDGFCELNFMKSCSDAIANEDYLYWAKGMDMLSGLGESTRWDAQYCQLNGFLARDIVELQHNFTGLRSRARELCDTKYTKHNIHTLTFQDMMSRSRYDDPAAPSLDDAEVLAAWNCAMGDLGCSMAMCAYSFCELPDGRFGVYGECPGWDPVQGMRP